MGFWVLVFLLTVGGAISSPTFFTLVAQIVTRPQEKKGKKIIMFDWFSTFNVHCPNLLKFASVSSNVIMTLAVPCSRRRVSRAVHCRHQPASDNYSRVRLCHRVARFGWFQMLILSQITASQLTLSQLTASQLTLSQHPSLENHRIKSFGCG